MSVADSYDVVVVGAGAAGIGVGAALERLDIDYCVVDREAVGHSFRQWPEETRLLTPSFPANSFGLPDLNAITPDSSPAFALDSEHPTGEEYADYLDRVVEFYDLSVETPVEITGITPHGLDSEDAEPVAVDGGVTAEAGFSLTTSAGPIETKFVVWAAGQFGAPDSTPFAGADTAVHYAEIESFRAFGDHESTQTGRDEFLIIGGYESGIDAACGLIAAGYAATVVDPGAPWEFRHPDPSESLAPFTRERLQNARETGRLSCLPHIRIDAIESGDGNPESDGSDPTVASGDPAGFDVYGVDSDGDRVHHWTPNRPILATGFESVLGPAESWFERGEDGQIELTDADESTTTPGLFYAGPAVVHNGVKFCFIYKFRSRFPVIAAAIGDRLGVDTEPLETYREANMYLEDLSCCEPDMCDC